MAGMAFGKGKKAPAKAAPFAKGASAAKGANPFAPKAPGVPKPPRPAFKKGGSVKAKC